ncbi:uncharacterized protein LY89DRAFT_504606 [Mollisia scopiformis]|uniref:Uncharacterized protein n=1 Tax=Mollisia scopiformis TaxID=149040 RepID=A0A194XF68_MOLSC|nr:uncharacterized protein LY89DRAFT_504606 [Mollisia scopiformis]KUJ18779.1 hypothetical protein LY89DRAFT_504606 [Mollisia scopiformis]
MRPQTPPSSNLTSKPPIINHATTLILLLNLTLLLSLVLSSLNASYFYASRTAGELDCLATHFSSQSLSANPFPYSSHAQVPPTSSPNPATFEAGKLFIGSKTMEKALEYKCRYPCYSTFGLWIGNKGIGAQGWEANGCERVHNICKAPLMRGKVGLWAAVEDWWFGL